jgi:hypothetical protein
MAEADDKSQHAAEGWIDSAQQAAKGAAQTVEERSARRHGGSRVDNGEVGTGVIVAGRLSTGREGWTEDLRAFMRERPLAGAALMIGVGYAVARFLRMRP